LTRVTAQRVGQGDLSAALIGADNWLSYRESFHLKQGGE